MSFMTPSMPAPPPAPEAPEPVDMSKAAAMADEAARSAQGRRKGRGSTVVAGALGKAQESTGSQPTLMG